MKTVVSYIPIKYVSYVLHVWNVLFDVMQNCGTLATNLICDFSTLEKHAVLYCDTSTMLRDPVPFPSYKPWAAVFLMLLSCYVIVVKCLPQYLKTYFISTSCHRSNTCSTITKRVREGNTPCWASCSCSTPAVWGNFNVWEGLRKHRIGHFQHGFSQVTCLVGLSQHLKN